MTAPAADLFARAIIAASISYGLDPVEAVTSQNLMQRRPLTAAGAALVSGAGLSRGQVTRILRLGCNSINQAVKNNRPSFWRAAKAAEEAIGEHLKLHPLEVRLVTARSCAEHAAAAKTGAKSKPPAVRAPARPTAKEAGQAVGWATRDKVVKPAAEPAPEPTVTDMFDALRRRPPPAPGDRGEPGPLPEAAAVIMPSPRCASRTVGKPAPLTGAKNPHGDNPADVGARQAEARFVHEKRAAGVPWSHIARQSGVSETTLRQRYDLSFEVAS